MAVDNLLRQLASAHNYEAAGRGLVATSTTTPTTTTHTSHLVVDTTNNELYFWNGSSYENISLMTFTAQGAVTSPTADVNALKTAVDAIVTNLVALGLQSA